MRAALFQTERFEQLLKILPEEEHDNEIVFLKGAALLGSGQTEDGILLLRQLWWREPNAGLGAFGLFGYWLHNPVARYQRRAKLCAVVPSVSHSIAYGYAARLSRRSLNRLSRNPFQKGQLRAEVRHASGARYIETEKLPEAIQMLRRALKARPGLHLKRAIQLDSGEAQRRRGAYKTAQFHFENVASGYIDTLSNEYREREPDKWPLNTAGTTMPKDILKPSSSVTSRPQSQSSTLGLGWVAWRCGECYKEARQFPDSAPK